MNNIDERTECKKYLKNIRKNLAQREAEFIISLAILGLMIATIVGISVYPSELMLVEVLVIMACSGYGASQIKDMIALWAVMKNLRDQEKVILEELTAYEDQDKED